LVWKSGWICEAKFGTYAEGLDLAVDDLQGPVQSAHVRLHAAGKGFRNGNFAYAYQWKAPMVWIAGQEDEAYPGAGRGLEKRAVAKVFAEMPVNIPIFGFPAAGEGVGIGEPPGVALSRYGKGLVCTDHHVERGSDERGDCG